MHISNCFDWFLDLVEEHFLFSDHPNASRIIDQIVIIREGAFCQHSLEVLATLMEGRR